MQQARLRAALVVALAAALLAACDDRPTPIGSGPAGTAGAGAPTALVDVATAEAALAPVIDPASHDLLALISREEWIEATIDIAAAKEVALAGSARGLTAQVVNDGTILLSGPRDDVAIFTAGAGPTHVIVAEDHRPTRWLPDAAPAVHVVNAGFPYRFAPLGIEPSGIRMTDDHRTALLSELARSIQTIDGRPYDRLSVTGECDPGQPPPCLVRAAGVTLGSGGREDSYLVVSAVDTGGVPRLDSVIRGAVPRALVRAAEWIARHDPAGSTAIAAYDSCCYGAWTPARPGVIDVTWTRQCQAAVTLPDQSLAATGDCFDSLTIVVDVGRATVVSIDARPGP